MLTKTASSKVEIKTIDYDEHDIVASGFLTLTDDVMSKLSKFTGVVFDRPVTVKGDKLCKEGSPFWVDDMFNNIMQGTIDYLQSHEHILNDIISLYDAAQGLDYDHSGYNPDLAITNQPATWMNYTGKDNKFMFKTEMEMEFPD